MSSRSRSAPSRYTCVTSRGSQLRVEVHQDPTTDVIEPTTGISRAHSSGDVTHAHPAGGLRGEDGERSSVAVNRMLIRSSWSIALRAAARQGASTSRANMLSRVVRRHDDRPRAARTSSRSPSWSWSARPGRAATKATGPVATDRRERRAWSASLREVAPVPRREVPQLHRADPTRRAAVTGQLERLSSRADLSLAPLGHHERELRAARRASTTPQVRSAFARPDRRPGRPRDASGEVAAAGRALDLHEVLLLDPVAGVGQRVREVAVVHREQQALAVAVEPP